MQETILKEIMIKLPSDLVDTISDKEIITLLLDKALSKAEYYRSRSNEYKEKHGMDFDAFKREVEKSKKEIFTDWDDLMAWEGYELGYQEWKKKYKELKSCMR